MAFGKAEIGCHAGFIGHADSVIGAKDAYAVSGSAGAHVVIHFEDAVSGEQFGLKLSPAQARNLAGSLNDKAAEVHGADCI